MRDIAESDRFTNTLTIHYITFLVIHNMKLEKIHSAYGDNNLKSPKVKLHSARIDAEKGKNKNKKGKEQFFDGNKMKKINEKKVNKGMKGHKRNVCEYKLMLELVIGYNGYDNLCRNNLYTLDGGELMYNILYWCEIVKNKNNNLGLKYCKIN
eukprot:285546_1